MSENAEVVVDPEPGVDGDSNPEPQAVADPGGESSPEPGTGNAGPEGDRPLTSNQQAQIRALIQQRDRQWQQHMASQTPQTPAAAGPSEPSDEDKRVRALYGSDEVGEKTFEAIEEHIRLRSGEIVTKAEAAQMARDAAAGVREQIQAGNQITAEVQSLVKDGMISPIDAETVQNAYSQKLSEPGMAHAAANSANAAYILKGTVYDMIKAGHLKPFTKPPQPTSPLTSGGNGSPAKPSVNPTLDTSKSPFAAVRAMGDDKVAELDKVSRTAYDRANAGA